MYVSWWQHFPIAVPQPCCALDAVSSKKPHTMFDCDCSTRINDKRRLIQPERVDEYIFLNQATVRAYLRVFCVLLHLEGNVCPSVCPHILSAEIRNCHQLDKKLLLCVRPFIRYKRLSSKRTGILGDG